MLRRLLLVTAPLVVAALALWLTLQGFTPGAAVAETVAEHPRYAVQGAIWTRYGDSGDAAFRAQAQTIDYYDDRSMQLREVTLDRLGAGGPWTLQAAEGEVPPGETRMQLRPEVEIAGALKSGAAAQIMARDVWVDWTKKTLASAAPVHLSSPDRELQAIGFESDWAGDYLRFLKQVQVHYAPPT